jgi:hypothetical protein
MVANSEPKDIRGWRGKRKKEKFNKEVRRYIILRKKVR